MENSIDALRASVRRLQRWNKLLLGAVVILALVEMAGAEADSRDIRARSIELVSADGDVLAALATRDGNPGLFLKDGNGTDRAALVHASDGTGLYISDAEGVTRIGVVQFAHGGGGLALHGPESRGAAVLYYKDEGSLRFFDADGAVTNQVAATPRD